jgi:hypothetical protein
VVFLIVWFPLWANVDVVNEVRSAFEAAVLTIVAAILLTWRSLISSIWIGLRGNKRIFVLTGLSYAIVPFIGLIGIAWTGGHKQAVLMWIVQNRDSVLSTLQWIAAIAVIAKLCSAALAWRRAEHVWHYFRFWIAGTTALIALAIVIPFDTYRLRTVMILLAPLVMPLARIGVAPSSFARNRHR